ncbi:unnamed protein product, partial [Bemisia tabaci]
AADRRDVVALCRSWRVSFSRVSSPRAPSSSFAEPSTRLGRNCEPIRVDLCKGLGYNVTAMPNLVGHELQGDAQFTLETFKPLIQYGCSAQLHFFLCSVYVPMCTEKVSTPIGPCRSLCESVRSRCFPVLQGFGFPWPAALKCAKFPEQNNHEHMCMEGPGEATAGLAPAIPLLPTIPRIPLQDDGPRLTPCSKYARANSYVFLNGTGRCAPLCDADVLFTRTDKTLAGVWFSIWAGLCFFASLVALLTFLVEARDERARSYYFHHPQVCLVLCYNLVSVGWGLTAILGHTRVACHLEPVDPEKLLLAQYGSGKAACALVFFFLYFFGTASLVWWTQLCLAWLMASVSQPTQDETKFRIPLFQISGWGLPAIQTVAALASRSVDADELTGICSIGNQSSQALLVLVVVPQLVYLILGMSFLGVGYLTQYRSCSGKSGKDRVSPDAHVGVFCLICGMPAVCVLLSHLYELWLREEWLLAVLSATPRAQPRPQLWVFLTRIFMSLVTGVVVSAWVSSPRSLQVWRRLWKKLEPRYKTTPVKCHQTIQYYHPQAHAHTHTHPRTKKILHKHAGSETIV